MNGTNGKRLSYRRVHQRWISPTGKAATNEIPCIVCLCGSTKFRQAFETANLLATLKGRIVLSVGCFTHADEILITPEDKLSLDELHKRKIDLADEVLILNVGGYIGESTKSELDYARLMGKVVRFLEDEK